MKNKLDITIKPLNDCTINITTIDLSNEIGGITRTFSSNNSDYSDLAMFMYNKSLKINCLFDDGSVKDICVINPYMGIRYTKIHPVLRKICKQICKQVSNMKGLED